MGIANLPTATVSKSASARSVQNAPPGLADPLLSKTRLLAMWATAYTVLYYAAACPARYAAQSVTKVCSFVFYNIFLLRIPSFACFRYPIEELLEELPFVNARNRKAWSIFIDTLKSDWAKSDGDCLIMLSLSATAVSVQALIFKDPSVLVIVMSLLAATYSLCSLCCTAIMKQLIGVVHDRPNAPHDWHAVTRHRASSSFATTNMLLATPVALRIWAYIFTALLAASFLWTNITYANTILDSIPTVLKMVSDMPQVAHGQPVPVVANYISPVARIPIIMAWAIGTMHIINVAISFSQLGFPLAQSPRPAAGVPSISVVDVRGRAALGTRTLVTYVRPIRLDTECASCSADSPHNKSDEALLDVEEDQTPDDGVSFFGYYTAVSSPTSCC